MRRALTPAIPPSAYRHFAIITLVLTAGLALFAEGEKHEAQALEAVDPAPAQAEAPAMFAAPAPSSRQGRTPHGWNDADSDFGRPMELLSGGGDSDVIPEEVTETLAPEDSTALTPQERQRLLQGLRESIRPTPTSD